MKIKMIICSTLAAASLTGCINLPAKVETEKAGQKTSKAIVSADQVPDAVKQALQTKFLNVNVAEWKIKPDKIYEAEFTLKGIEITVMFDSAGKWLETESAIDPARVPKVVSDAAANQFKGYKVIETQSVDLWNEQRPIYELHLENVKETVKVQFSADGAILIQSAKPNAAKTNDAPQTLPKFTHPLGITNPYLPLASLKQDILKNAAERVERTTKPEVHKTFQVGGQTVEALTVEDREFNAAGELIEATLDYFAQDDDGNVYYMGEDVNEYKNGKVSGHSGAWLFGKDTQRLGLLMPAHPKIGDKFKSEDAPPITWEADEIVSLSETVTVPAGTFRNCLKVKEIASDGDTEYKLYAPNIGCVEEIEGTIPLLLQSHAAK
jgi:hypothetical protein